MELYTDGLTETEAEFLKQTSTRVRTNGLDTLVTSQCTKRLVRYTYTTVTKRGPRRIRTQRCAPRWEIVK